MIRIMLEYLAIVCFVGLTAVGLLAKDWNYAGLNFSLALLYIFLYVQPFK